MAVTVSQFRAQFPEFRTTPTPVIERGLSDALRQLNLPEWGDSADEAQKYLAADFIARGPLGEKARLKKGENVTTYMNTFKFMKKSTIGGFRVL